jgi:hypothetical protein
MLMEPKGKGGVKPLREVPRIHIPLTPANKGRKKGPGIEVIEGI